MGDGTGGPPFAPSQSRVPHPSAFFAKGWEDQIPPRSASNRNFLSRNQTSALKLAQPIPTRRTLNHPAAPGRAPLHPLRSQFSVGLIAVMIAKLSAAARADSEILRRVFQRRGSANRTCVHRSILPQSPPRAKLQTIVSSETCQYPCRNFSSISLIPRGKKRQ
jgi:hypothetical protein